MDNYTFKKTNSIASEFKYQDLVFNVTRLKDLEIICISFFLNNGPVAEINFMCDDTDNDISARSVLLHSIPKESKGRVLEACNTIHSWFSHFIIFIDDDNDLIFKYDRECRTPIEYSAGETAYDMYRLITIILNCIWSMIAHAVYSNNEDSEECSDDFSNSLFRFLEESVGESPKTNSKSHKHSSKKKSGNHKKDNKADITLTEKYLNLGKEEQDSDEDNDDESIW